MNSIFITGTDTGVGKTIITGLLAKFLKQKGLKVVPQKWIQTGCCNTSEDIEKHLEFISSDKSVFDRYSSDMAPYILKYPSSPHLASALENISIEPSKIKDAFLSLSRDFDVVLAEGSGGVLVPVNTEKLIIDIASDIGLSAIIVAENRLGAINQTLLAIEAIRKRGMNILGVVFNRISAQADEAILNDNMHIIRTISGETILGEIRYNEDYGELYSEFEPIGEKIYSYLK